MQNNPVAIVTGASRGIGKAVALNFAHLGYDLALIARDESLLHAVNSEIKDKYPVNTGVFALDVANKSSVDETIHRIITTHGRIDILFNNAGILCQGTSEIDPADFESMIQINLFGFFNFIHAVAPHMKKQRSGYIMNLASLAGKVALASTGGYAASKFAVVGLSEALFNEMLAYNVKVTAICPSVIATDMTEGIQNFPNEEKISVNDIVETVNFLLKLSPKAIIKDIDVHNTFYTKQRNLSAALLRKY